MTKTETNIGSVNTLGGSVAVVSVVVISDSDGDAGVESAVVIPGIDGGADAIIYLGLLVHYLDRIMYVSRRVSFHLIYLI